MKRHKNNWPGLVVTATALLLTLGNWQSNAQCPLNKVDFDHHWGIVDPLTLFFSDQTQIDNGNILEWHWDFGDGQSSVEANPSHTFPAPGTYTVCLSVKAADEDGNLCQRQTCRPLVLGDDCDNLCYFRVEYRLDGADLLAWLVSEPYDPQYPDTIRWYLNGELVGSAPKFRTLFDQAGRHVLWANYKNPDGSSCNSVRAITLVEPCVDSSKIDPNAGCLAIWEPVCGCDGVTYGNACEAEKAGLNSWSPGVCGTICNSLGVYFDAFNAGASFTYWNFQADTFFQHGQINELIWDFGDGQGASGAFVAHNFPDTGTYTVCLTALATGSDGETCQTRICQEVRVGPDACTDPGLINELILCPTVYDPVCGCDGITYDNDCIAMYRFGISQWTPGVCPNQCTDSTWINPDVGCITIIDPVCGCDGETYSNSCEALYHHGITDWKGGPCCVPKACRALFAIEQLSPIAFRFYDLSENAESWTLDFGDQLQHTGYFDSIVHLYELGAAYDICLTISNVAGDCTDTYCIRLDLGSTATRAPQTPPISIRPNPASDMARITLLPDQPQGDLRLYDLSGRLVWLQQEASGVIDIPTAQLPNGMYQVQWQGASRVHSVRLVVIH